MFAKYMYNGLTSSEIIKCNETPASARNIKTPTVGKYTYDV